MKKDFYAYSEDVFTDDLIYFKPNKIVHFGRFSIESPLFKHQISLNNLCFRSEDDFVTSENENVIKIAVIGDSYVAGFDVSIPWTEHLEKSLNDKFNKSLNLPSNKRVKIYNLGLPGTGPSNWIAHKKTLEIIKPDFLIIGLVNNILLRPQINFFVDKDKGFIFTKYENQDILCKGVINNRLNDLTKKEITLLHNKYNDVLKTEPKNNIVNSLNYLDRNYNYLKELTQSYKSLIVQFPTYNTFHNDLSNNEQFVLMKEYASSTDNIQFLNIKDSMKNNLNINDIYIQSGDHFNSAGNKYMTYLISKYLIENGLIL